MSTTLPGRSPAKSASNTGSPARRRRPIGAEVQQSNGVGGVHFRVWSPKRNSINVVVEGGPGEGITQALARSDEEYFEGFVEGAGAGTLYRFQIDGTQTAPDPVSRFQPSGPHGPSQVIDPCTFEWTDKDWRGIEPHGQILYEMHVGT